MKREGLGPSLTAAVAPVPDMHAPCAPDAGRPVHLRVPTAPQAVLSVRARSGLAGEMRPTPRALPVVARSASRGSAATSSSRARNHGGTEFGPDKPAAGSGKW